jgi:hypothetical protein
MNGVFDYVPELSGEIVDLILTLFHPLDVALKQSNRENIVFLTGSYTIAREIIIEVLIPPNPKLLFMMN